MIWALNLTEKCHFYAGILSNLTDKCKGGFLPPPGLLLFAAPACCVGLLLLLLPACLPAVPACYFADRKLFLYGSRGRVSGLFSCILTSARVLCPFFVSWRWHTGQPVTSECGLARQFGDLSQSGTRLEGWLHKARMLVRLSAWQGVWECVVKLGSQFDRELPFLRRYSVNFDRQM